MRRIIVRALSCLAIYSAAAHSQPVDNGDIDIDIDIDAKPIENELSYKSYIHNTKRIKCLYGYAANKTGDHAAAIQIFEDCIRRWQDVFSMIGLAQLYETGIGIEQNFGKSVDLIKQAANINNETSYPSLARYHYGVALAEGRGIEKNIAEARIWLKKAAAEGVKEAADYLQVLDAVSQ